LGIQDIELRTCQLVHLELKSECKMTISKIDSEISAADLADTLAVLESVRLKLSFLIGLTPIERRRVVKLGRKSQTFVVQALDAATQYSNLMPGCLNVEEARRDLALFEALNPILQSINQLKELVEDTQMLAGSEAYEAARVAYASIKTIGKSMGLDEVREDLGQQFRKQRKSTPS
jgi:hypothetical protein